MATHSSFQLTERIYNTELLDLVKKINSRHTCLSDDEKRVIKNIQNHKSEIAYTKPKSGIGRFQVGAQPAFVTINKEWRHSLCGEGNIVGLDFVNSAPTDLWNYSQDQGLSTPALYQYVNERQAIWATMSEHLGTDNNQNKKLINALTFGGTIASWAKKNNIKIPSKTKIAKVKFLANYEQDIAEIKRNLQSTKNELYLECYNFTKNFKQKEWNEEGSALANWCYETEAIQIRKFMEHCESRKLVVSSYINDEVHLDLNLSVALDEESLKQWVKENCRKRLTITSVVPFEEVLVRVKEILDLQVEPSMDYETVKEEFEKTHAKINYPLVYICTEPTHNNELPTYKRKDLLERYENKPCVINGKEHPFAKTWIGDPHIRSYEYQDLYPFPEVCPPTCFNLWFGYDVDKWETKLTEDSEAVKMFRELLFINCGETQDMFDFVQKFIAHMFQFPGKRCEIALIIIGSYGTGKSKLVETLKEMMGEGCSVMTTNPKRDIFGNFNHSVKGKFLVHLEEPNKSKTIDIEQDLLSFITARNNLINQKYKDGLTVRNYSRVIATTNSKTPVKIDVNDRRYCVTRCTDKYIQNTAHFAKYDQVVLNNKSGLRAIYDWLMSIDIPEDYNWLGRPQSDHYKLMQAQSVPNEWLWLHYLSEQGGTGDMVDNNGGVEFGQTSKWFRHYHTWLEDYGYKYGTDLRTFGVMLMGMVKDDMGIKHEPSKSRKGYKFYYQEIKENINKRYAGLI